MPAVKVADLVTYHRNPRRGDIDLIVESLRELGQYRPLIVNRGTLTGRENEVLAGNHTLLAARRLGWDEVEVHFVDYAETEAARVVVVDNRSADLGGYDEQALADLLDSLPDLTATGFTLDDLADLTAGLGDDGQPAMDVSEARETLAERFGVPPFTVLDARAGRWQARKRAWRALGLASHEGRGDALTYDSPQTTYANWYDVKNVAQARAGRTLTDAELLAAPEAADLKLMKESGASIFDPVLTEMLIRWFSKPGDNVLDPWAGGSVRGVVAGALGRHYLGVELRAEQVQANEPQADLATLVGGDQAVTPEWMLGDSSLVLDAMPAGQFDMVIGCPPYYDAERYSDDPADLSNMTTVEYEAAMRRNLAAVARVMRDDSFAVFIVGAARDKAGLLRDLRAFMVDACRDIGLGLANDAVLVTVIGNLATTTPRMFKGARSLGRCHQDILVFVKGDRRKAAELAGDVEAETLSAIDDAVNAQAMGDDDGSRSET